jgi:hypothetical protein
VSFCRHPVTGHDRDCAIGDHILHDPPPLWRLDAGESGGRNDGQRCSLAPLALTLQRSIVNRR